MTPEADRFFKQPRISIGRARTMLTVGLAEDAGRAAYLACCHAAQADIFERTGRSSKTHHGVQTEFFRLTKDDTRLDPLLRRFLSQSYEFRLIADYFTGGNVSVSQEQAEDATAIAARFVAHVVELLANPL